MNDMNELHENKEKDFKQYFPLLLIFLYLFLGIFSIIYSNERPNFMNLFMGSFFLVFSFFKFLNLKGFAETYSSYDIIAKRFFNYGYIYPFLELILGVLYLSSSVPKITNLFTLILMLVSASGVVNNLLKKQKIKCACLGTFFDLPLSNVTLLEDLIMASMALFMIIKLY